MPRILRFVGHVRGAGPQNLALPTAPVAVAKLAAGSCELADVSKQIVPRLTWPGRPAPAVETQRRTAEEETRFNTGKDLYAKSCAGCHQAEGLGSGNLGAPLVGSRWVIGATPVLVRIVVNGKEGAKGLMPPVGASMTDDHLAAILTYIRGSWGNTATAVSPFEVKETRLMYSYRKTPWTDQELNAGRGGRGGRGNQ